MPMLLAALTCTWFSWSKFTRETSRKWSGAFYFNDPAFGMMTAGLFLWRIFYSHILLNRVVAASAIVVFTMMTVNILISVRDEVIDPSPFQFELDKISRTLITSIGAGAVLAGAYAAVQ